MNHFVVVLCLASFILFSPSRVPAAEPRAAKVEDGYVTTGDGIRLYYQKAGKGKQTVVVPLRLSAFEDFKRLADGWTVISYDMRNRGKSDSVADGAKISIDHDVADLESVRRHFKLKKFHVVGYSYLGLMVALYATRHPRHVERVVQLGPIACFGTQYPANLAAPDDGGVPEAELEKVEKLIEQGRGDSKELCEKWWRLYRFRLVGDPARVEKMGGGPCDMPNEHQANLNRHFGFLFPSIQKLGFSSKQAAGVRHPVLVVHGTKDRNAPYGAGREWAMSLPNARLLTVEGAAHKVFAEFPEIVFPAIRSFLEGKWPAGAEKVTVLNP